MNTPLPQDPDAHVHTLPNGVRVLTLPLPWLDSVSVSVYISTGSRDEPAGLAGISHFVEHMAFKGTATRDGRQLNLDAERLGADVNAHTDKDHTAYHLRGRARDAETFIAQLADIVLQPVFPPDEIEHERQVILQEYVEDEDDPMSIAFRMFDVACYGDHPLGHPVIGTRAVIERLGRDDLMAYVQRQYTGGRLIVAVAGPVDPAAMVRAAERHFGAMPAGAPAPEPPPRWLGGIQVRRIADSLQSHLVLGYPIAGVRGRPEAGQLAAAVFGEGMSSPLMHEIREKRGLAYYAACSADVLDDHGEFLIEVSTAPEHFDEVAREIRRLLLEHARPGGVPEDELMRARNLVAVRRLRAHERPGRRLENAALDLFAFGLVRDPRARLARLEAVTAAEVEAEFARLLAQPVALAASGKLKRGVQERLSALYAA